ncbi:MAG TPA: hypothetical protein VL882_15460, partial [Vicinamibacterales bacterium]|nr:hypothetical protein [Vicinamibacterales bacterium]
MTRRYPYPNRRRDGPLRLRDNPAPQRRARPGGEREIEVVVFHIDHRVDKYAPLLARARCVRL